MYTVKPKIPKSVNKKNWLLTALLSQGQVR